MQNRPNQRPFDDDAAAIRHWLEAAQVPALLASLVHLTGNADHLAGFQPPSADMSAVGDENGGMPADQLAAARDLATRLLLDWRAQGYPPLPRPDAAALDAAMNFVAGQPIPAAYHDFLVEQLHVDGRPRAGGAPISAPAADKAAFPVIIIGAGMSGLLAGIACREQGLPFTIIDAQARVGGTWAANTYPGCRVDTPNHLYSYSFAPAHPWPNRYSPQPVLQRYFADMAASHGLEPHIRLNTRVTGCHWDGHCWQVAVAGPDGPQTLQARAVISALGQLNKPRLPDLPGIASFAGPAFHSAEWRDDVPLQGKRVAVVGTGASAFQIVPEIVGEVAALHLFQRTPPWTVPVPAYHDPVAPGMQWALDHLPFYANWYRFNLFWQLTEFLLPAVRRDDGWTQPGSLSEANAGLRAMLEMAISAQFADRPDLAGKVIPAYAPGGKRMLVDNGLWAAALKQPHVELVTDAIAAVELAGLRMADGRLVEVDVIIWATGFRASDFIVPMQVTTAAGRDLAADWGGDAKAYLGMTVPGFPNFFMLYGPNTNIVVNGSIVFFSECSVRYIMGCIRQQLDAGAPPVDPRPDVVAAFNARVDAENARMAWAAPDVNSWYKNAHGRVSQNWPFPLVDYWQATLAPDMTDFV